MRFASLGSGSKGNGTLVYAGSTCLLVDCGFGRREAERRLAERGMSPQDLDAILVTHEHGDHSGGVSALSKRYALPVFASHGTLASNRLTGSAQTVAFNAGDAFTVGDIDVQSVAVPHDAREPVQFCFHWNALKLGVLTDLGSLTPHVVEAFTGCTALLLESNHDLELLTRGPYPPSLKRRVGGDYGHLNNTQTRELLLALPGSPPAALVLAHLSEQNNTLEHVYAAIDGAYDPQLTSLTIAEQAQGFDWIDVSLESHSVHAETLRPGLAS